MKSSKVVSLFALPFCALALHCMSTIAIAENTSYEEDEVVSDLCSVQMVVEQPRLEGIGAVQEVEILSVNEKLDFTNQLVLFDEENYEEPVVFTDCHVTAYCNCEKCCGEYAWKHTTSTGVETTEGITIAVDPEVIPYGSIVELDGHFYIAEDCGGAIDGVEIDVYIEDVGGRHTRCKEFMRNLGKDYGNEIRVWMPKES